MTTATVVVCGVLLHGLIDLEAIHAQGVLPDALLKKIKSATVHLKVKLASGTDVEGTGWFVEPRLIVTNAHVVGLQGQDAKNPQKIEAVINSGEANTKTVLAKFAGGDIDADLAILRVTGDGLPEPLTMGSTADLVETQDVLIFGFPFGKDLGKAITVGKSSVTSLRKNGSDLNEIQVNGGINPGNSGGPVVNLKGEVVGIAVSGIKGTTINQAIPVDKLIRLLNGRVLAINTQPAIIEGGQVRIPVRLTIRDPLLRIKNLQVEHWVGTIPTVRGARPASSTRPAPFDGDSEINTIDVTFDGKSAYANCEVQVPTLADDKTCHWLRATYVDGLGRAQWTQAAGNIRPIPTERREITLKFQPTTGAGTPMQITNDSTFKVQIGKTTNASSMHVKVITNPTYLAPIDPDGDIPMKWRYSSVTLGMKVDGKPVNVKEKWNPLGQNFLKTNATIEFANTGYVVNSRADIGKADADMKSTMDAISEHLLQSVEMLSIPLPDGPLRPLVRLRAQRSVLIGVPGAFVPALADIKYQYLGVRTLADGTQTAVFELTGSLRSRRGDDTKVGGRINGGIDLLLSTGEVHAGVASVLVDTELTEGGQIRLQGTLSIDYRRPPQTAKPATTGDAKPETEPATEKKPATDTTKSEPDGKTAKP